MNTATVLDELAGTTPEQFNAALIAAMDASSSRTPPQTDAFNDSVGAGYPAHRAVVGVVDLALQDGDGPGLVRRLEGSRMLFEALLRLPLAPSLASITWDDLQAAMEKAAHIALARNQDGTAAESFQGLIARFPVFQEIINQLGAAQDAHEPLMIEYWEGARILFESLVYMASVSDNAAGVMPSDTTCPQCGAVLRSPNAAFCSKCGRPQTRAPSGVDPAEASRVSCSCCGAALRSADAAFCGKCGEQQSPASNQDDTEPVTTIAPTASGFGETARQALEGANSGGIDEIDEIDEIDLSTAVALAAEAASVSGYAANMMDGAKRRRWGSANRALDVANAAAETCAVITDGTIKCWGENVYGQLGAGYETSGPETCSAQYYGGYPCSATPVEVSGITDATTVSAGGQTVCATLSTGAVECWGFSEDGGLGDSSTTAAEVCKDQVGEPKLCATTPVRVSDITTATEVAASNAHACALLTSGGVDCWGWNVWGQLGDGSVEASDVPVSVAGIP